MAPVFTGASTFSPEISDLLTKPLDYSEEIEDFRKRWEAGEVNGMPVVNQDTVLTQMLRVLTTEYPYVNLYGSPGIGKSKMMALVRDSITGKIPDDSLGEIFSPSDLVLIKDARARLEKIDARSYLSLPNLANPTEVRPLSYSSLDELSRDWDVAQEFCDQLGGFLGTFARDNREKFKFSMTDANFRSYAQTIVREAYISRLEEFSGEMESRGISSHRRQPLPIVRISHLRNSSSSSFTDLEATLEFDELEAKGSKAPSYGKLKVLVGVDSSTRMTKEAVVETVGSNYFGKGLGSSLEFLLASDLNRIDVEGLDFAGKVRFVREEIERFSEEASDYLLEERSSRGVQAFEIGTKLRTRFTLGKKPKKKLSGAVLDDIIGAIERVGEEYSSKDCSGQLKEWISGTVSYFRDNKSILEERIRLMGIELDEIERKKRDVFERLLKVPSGDKGDKKKSEVKSRAELLEELYGGISLMIPHGRSDLFNIRDILNPNELISTRSSSTSSVVPLSSYDTEDLVGEIDDDDDVPPHLRLRSLGDLFGGSILFIRDDLGSLVEYIADESSAGDRTGVLTMDNVLEWLQTGDLVVTSSGVQYQFHMPKFLLSSSNDDPFITQGSIDYIRHEGLADRITTVSVPESINNDRETREGTLKVIYGALDRFNEAHEGSDVRLEVDAANILLTSSLRGRARVDLAYRDLERTIFEIAGYARAHGSSNISRDLISRRIREEMGPNFYANIEEDFFAGNGYSTYPESSPGVGSALAVWPDGTGESTRVKASLVARLWEQGDEEQPFFYVDAQDNTPGMLDETAKKAFKLSTDYLEDLLVMGLSEEDGHEAVAGIDRKYLDSKLWRLSLQKPENWGGMGGPSSSALITVTMLSALSGREMYKNRFMTGTIESAGGVGIIGGIQGKASAPYRIKQLEREIMGRKDPKTYLIFPEGNLYDLNVALEVDPLGMKDDLEAIAVGTFEAAYYLATAPEEDMIPENWARAHELGRQYIAEDLRAAERRISNIVGQRSAN